MQGVIHLTLRQGFIVDKAQFDMSELAHNDPFLCGDGSQLNKFPDGSGPPGLFVCFFNHSAC